MIGHGTYRLPSLLSFTATWRTWPPPSSLAEDLKQLGGMLKKHDGKIPPKTEQVSSENEVRQIQ